MKKVQNTYDSYIIKIFLIIGTSLILANINKAIPAGGDSALYLEQTKAIVESSTKELLDINVKMQENSLSKVGPSLYPPGTPILFSPIYIFFKFNNIPYRLANTIMYVFSLILFFKVFNIKETISKILFLTLFMFNIYLFGITFQVLSDTPFFFFCSLVFYFVHKFLNTKNLWVLIIAGFFAGVSFTIRANGIIFPFAFAALLFFINDPIQSKLKYLTIFTIGFALFSLPVLYFYPDSGSSHINHLKILSFEELVNQLFYNLALIGRLFYDRTIYYFILPIIIIGIYNTNRRSTVYIFIEIFLVLTIMLFTIWPYRNGVRFLLPILPIVADYFINGLRAISLPQKIENLLCIAISIAFLSLSTRSIVNNYFRFNQITNLDYTELGDFIRIKYPEEEFVITKNPRFFRFSTGLQAIRVFGSGYDFTRFNEYRGEVKIVALENECNKETPENWRLIYKDDFWSLYEIQ